MHPAARSALCLGILLAGCAVWSVSVVAPAAVAAPGGDATVQQTAFATTVMGASGSTASCPAGSRAVGGGLGTTGTRSGVAYIQSSRPLNQAGAPATLTDGDIAGGWAANVYTSASADADQVFALCSASSDATIQETTVTLGKAAQDARATCPVGTRVVGGGAGFGATPGINSQVIVSGPVDETGLTANTSNGDIARSWYASIAGSGTAQVFALCSAGSDATVEETTFTTGAQSPNVANAVCPPGRRALGGGIGTTTAPTTGDILTAPLHFSGPLDETGSTTATVDGDVARAWTASVDDGRVNTYKVFALCAADDAGGASAGPGGVPGGGGRGVDTLRPVVRSLGLSRRSFRALHSRGGVGSAPIGTRVNFSLSEPAAVLFKVQKALRRRYVTLAGSITRHGGAGANAFEFTGRLRGRALRPGRYRLSAVATDLSKNASVVRRVGFRIVR